MTTIMLVAGSSTKALAKSLEDRSSSLKVEYVFDSLMKHAEEMRTGIYRVDKLVYVYRDDSLDIRKDMRILQDLLLGDAYFNVHEIVFFISDPEGEYDGLKFFNSVMSEVRERAETNSAINIPSERVFKYNDTLTYDIIYTQLLGISESLKVDNSFVPVYRVERHSGSKKAYEADDFTDAAPIEPFSYIKLKKYEELQKSVKANDSGEPIIDSEIRSPLKKVDADFGSLDYKDPATRVNIVLVSGNRKSGTTTFALSLAASLMAGRKKTLLLDMSRNKGLSFSLPVVNLPYSEYKLEETLLEKYHEQEHDIAVISDYDYKLRYHVLVNLLGSLTTYNCDFLIIDCHSENLEEVSKILSRFTVKTFITSGLKEQDIEEVKDLFEKVKESNLVITEVVNSQSFYADMKADDVKISMPNLVNLMKCPVVEDFDLDEYFAQQLLGVK